MDFTVLTGDRRVIRADSEKHAELEASGWQIIARSWGAGLKRGAIDRAHLTALMDSHSADVVIRELTEDDATAILHLDASTLGDYPGDIATAHQALTAEHASPTAEHRGWGAFTPAGELVAFTFPRPTVTETEFTVVHRRSRGQGLGTAIKAASVLALAAEGYNHFRTGGSGDNAAIIAANRTVGYVLDEKWLTLATRLSGSASDNHYGSNSSICGRAFIAWITSSLPLSKTSTTVSSSLP